MKLRPYQEEARKWVNVQLNQGNNPLLIMPTGSGKSPTSAEIARNRISLKKRILVLVPQYELFTQMLVDYSDMEPGYIDDTGVNGRNRNIYICMVQSLVGMLDALPEKFCKSFSEIIIDEAHFSGAETWEKIYDHFSHCLRFGMTATPLRYDNKPLGNYFDCMYEPIKISECIKRGYLAKPIIIVPEEYKAHIPTEINEDEINRDIIQKGKIIGDMVLLYRHVFNGLPVIIPCANTEHAKQIATLYKNDGWVVDHIHSGLTKHERSRIVKDVRNRKTNILITVGVGIFGLNITGLMGIIWLRFTESLTIYMQFNGRPMRIDKGKNTFVMIDPVGNSIIHGRPDIDRKWSLDTEYTPGAVDDDIPTMKVCPQCNTMNATINEKCWICGYDFLTSLPVDKKKRKLPRFIDGELVWLDDENEGVNNGKNNDVNINADNKSAEKNNDSDNKNIELTRAEKMEILKRDLTGLKHKTKFREGIKWL